MKNRNDDGNSPCTSKQQQQLTQPTPSTVSSSIAYRSLTKIELMKNGDDSQFINAFLQKNGLMERILGYKMTQGRVESYEVMKHVVDLDSCASEPYEVNFFYIKKYFQY